MTLFSTLTLSRPCTDAQQVALRDEYLFHHEQKSDKLIVVRTDSEVLVFTLI